MADVAELKIALKQKCMHLGKTHDKIKKLEQDLAKARNEVLVERGVQERLREGEKERFDEAVRIRVEAEVAKRMLEVEREKKNRKKRDDLRNEDEESAPKLKKAKHTDRFVVIRRSTEDEDYEFVGKHTYHTKSFEDYYREEVTEAASLKTFEIVGVRKVVDGIVWKMKKDKEWSISDEEMKRGLKGRMYLADKLDGGGRQIWKEISLAASFNSLVKKNMKTQSYCKKPGYVFLLYDWDEEEEIVDEDEEVVGGEDTTKEVVDEDGIETVTE